MEGKFLFIGTGASTGIPMIGCTCSVCTSSSPLNMRLRPSALVTFAGKKYIIDVGPDFRQQALKYEINDLDGALLTHCHYDHVAGVNELRVYRFHGKEKKMPLLFNEETFEEIQRRCHYLMEPMKNGEMASSIFEFHTLKKDFGSLVFEGLPLQYFSYIQMDVQVHGFRFGNLAYVPDIVEYDERLLEALAGTEVLIVDALKEKATKAHFSLEQAIGFSQKLGVAQTYFTHIAHEMDHLQVSKKLPGNCALAYDGLELTFEMEGL